LLSPCGEPPTSRAKDAREMGHPAFDKLSREEGIYSREKHIYLQAKISALFGLRGWDMRPSR